jgi:hypothetical protein
MSIKMTGKDFKEFYESDWGDVWIDDDIVTVDGVDIQELDNISDSSTVVIQCGLLRKNDSDEIVGDLVKAAREWKRKQSICRVVCEIPKDRYDEIVEIMKTLLKVKVIS